MKKLVLILPFLLFGFIAGSMAQKEKEGVYLSANDFANGKISFANNQGKKYKLYLHENFNTSTIKIIIGDSVARLNKDSIFGYRDNKNTCYRFYNKEVYKMMNPSEKILLYSKTSTAGGFRSNHTVTNYFFSSNAASPVYSLSKWNLKTVLSEEVSFHELLDIYFHSDNELTAYDSLDKIYMLNRIYELSKQKKTVNNN